jgi:hypothetical protein
MTDTIPNKDPVSPAVLTSEPVLLPAKAREPEARVTQNNNSSLFIGYFLGRREGITRRLSENRHFFSNQGVLEK